MPKVFTAQKEAQPQEYQNEIKNCKKDKYEERNEQARDNTGNKEAVFIYLSVELEITNNTLLQ